MKKQVLLFLYSFLITTTSFSQSKLSSDYSYTVSQPYKVIDGVKDYFYSNGEMMTVKRYKRRLYIQKFDTQTLKEALRTEYKISDEFPDNFVVEDIIQLQDRFFYFYSSWSGRKTKQERLYFREIDFKSGKFIGEAVKLIDVEGKLPWADYGKFDFLVSKDESKILIQYRKNQK